MKVSESMNGVRAEKQHEVDEEGTDCTQVASQLTWPDTPY